MINALSLPWFGGKAANGNDASKSAPLRVARDAYLDPAAALTLFETSREGLTHEEGEKRLDRDGRNEVAHEKPPAWYVQLLLTLKNPFTLILAGLALVSYLTEDIKAVIVLGTMIVLSVVLRFAQQYRSTPPADGPKAQGRPPAPP